MVFIPRVLLQEQMALKQAKAEVDAKVARLIYFKSQTTLEDATGEPCWVERAYVLFLCLVAVLLLVASAYLAVAQRNWVAIAVVGVATLGVVRLESLAVRRLTPLLFVLLISTLASVIASETTWLKLLIGAIFVYFLSFAYAARVTFLMMMRNDRAYRALYLALRFRFPNNP